MKYALLTHDSSDCSEGRKDPAVKAAGMAYGEALRAAGVIVSGAGLQPPQSATIVSVRDGKRHVHDGPYAETRSFSAASSSSMCRTWMPRWNSMESLLAAYKSLAKGARTAKPNLHPAVDRFEPLLFNHLVVVLDGFSVHRSRTIEGKDGNPLNEFRMICTSLLQNHGVMCTDKTNNKTIKYSPENSGVKINIGDEIKLT